MTAECNQPASSKPEVENTDLEYRDPTLPKNWSSATKATNLIIIGAFRFLSPLASTIVAPVASNILSDLDSSSEILASFVVSSFLIGYVFGPLIISPLSELYGRLPLYHVNNSLFVLWSVAGAIAPNLQSLIVFRVLAGMAGSCPVVLGNGSLSDCIEPNQRGFVNSIYALGPIVGPTIGPLIGGFLGEAAGWRWNFWLVVLIGGILTIFGFIFQKETYEKILLARRDGRSSLVPSNFSEKTSRQSFFEAMFRPLAMLFKSPVILITSIYTGLVYGYMYLLFTTFFPAYEKIYGFTPQTTGLTYLGFGVGCSTGLFLFGYFSDRVVAFYSVGREWQPEYRLLPLLPGSLIIPIGLLWYGWSIQARLHWMMPVVGTAFVGFGVLAVFMPIQAYLIDAFVPFSASATAANTVFRSLVGALLSLSGPALYRKLGYGWGNTLLAILALLFTPITLLIYKYGGHIRLR